MSKDTAATVLSVVAIVLALVFGPRALLAVMFLLGTAVCLLAFGPTDAQREARRRNRD